MVQYVDKSALVAEIERRLEELYELLPDAGKVEKGIITISEACNTGKYTALESFKDYIDTLEVKEVDLEEEIQRQYEVHKNHDNSIVKDCVIMTKDGFEYFAKYFFEFGIKAQKGE